MKLQVILEHPSGLRSYNVAGSCFARKWHRRKYLISYDTQIPLQKRVK